MTNKQKDRLINDITSAAFVLLVASIGKDTIYDLASDTSKKLKRFHKILKHALR